MKKHMIAATLVLALVAPTLALACHVSDLDANFNCDGWTAVIAVQFTDGVEQVELDWAVTLLDLEENPLEYVAERITVVKPADSLIAYVELSDIWHGYYSGAGFKAAIAADVVGSDQPMGFIADLQCTVPTEETTWDAVKSHYR